MRAVLTGNEAAAYAALESGIKLAASYPGAPVSEILSTIAKFSKDLGVHAEWAINEKVALELGAGASFAGRRAIVSCKHVGGNVLSDTLNVLSYVGTVGGLVLVIGDDPVPQSSQNAQDPRYLALTAKIPVIEPTSSQEAHDFVKFAFTLSESLSLPVMIKMPYVVAKGSGVVEYGEFSKPVRINKDLDEKITLPGRSKVLHEKLAKKYRSLRLPEFSEWIKGEGLAFVTWGVAGNYVLDAFPNADLFWIKSIPFDKEALISFLEDREKVYIVEEGDPVLETLVRSVASELSTECQIIGKGTFPLTGELSPDLVKASINRGKVESSPVPKRIPALCAGCPHRASYWIIKKAVEPDTIIVGDRGCYNLGAHPPLRALKILMNMGSSAGVASGLVICGKKAVAVMGDSTFFHSGLQGILNAKYQGIDLKVFILDNSVTAMTGHQPNPGSGFLATGDPAEKISIEGILEGTGIPVLVLDPFDLWDSLKKVSEFIRKPGVRVVIFRRTCALVLKRKGLLKEKYEVDREKCVGCQTCLRELGCPAIKIVDGKAMIDEEKCVGCGICAKICPTGAIKRKS